jgi:hypothetical protein
MMKPFLAALLLFVAGEASAASRVSIAEFGSTRVEAAAPFAQLPAIVKQTLDISAGVQTSQPFNAKTRYIRLLCEVQCAITATGVATTNSSLIPALRPEYFGVSPGMTISVIAAP